MGYRLTAYTIDISEAI